MIWRTVTPYLCSDLNKGRNAFDYLSCELIEQTLLGFEEIISRLRDLSSYNSTH